MYTKKHMNAFGVHYIRVVPFEQRRMYAATINTMGSYRAVVVTCSAWFDTDYRCCIVHKNQPLKDMLQHMNDIPCKNIVVFDAVTKENMSLDTVIGGILPKHDLTRYVHVVVI